MAFVVCFESFPFGSKALVSIEGSCLVMKFLFDLLPVILFFAVFKIAGARADEAALWASSYLGDGITAQVAPILLATATAIVASIAQLIWLLLRGQKVEPMFWISVAVIVVFGGLTLYFREGTFILWKPTILYWIFASILGYGTLVRKNFVKAIMGKAQINMPDKAWWMLQTLCMDFFVAMGFINLAVAYLCSLDTWVSFKLFGLMGLTIVFTIAVAIFMTKHSTDGQN